MNHLYKVEWHSGLHALHLYANAECIVQKKKKNMKSLLTFCRASHCRKNSVKIDDFGEVAKHAVSGTSDNDGIAEESANYMWG